jgi:hypothetical protein
MANVCLSGNSNFMSPCPPYQSATLSYSCVDFDASANECLTYDWVEVTPAKQCDKSLDINDPAVGQLIGAIALLFATAFVFNFLFKFILNKK